MPDVIPSNCPKRSRGRPQAQLRTRSVVMSLLLVGRIPVGNPLNWIVRLYRLGRVDSHYIGTEDLLIQSEFLWGHFGLPLCLCFL